MNALRKALLLSVAATLMATAPAARADEVIVYSFDFEFSIHHPAQNEFIEDPVIFVGDTVRWIFLDELHDTVACLNQADHWESEIFGPGDSFVYTFNIPGVYNYFCSPHGYDNGDGTASGMTALITVLARPCPADFNTDGVLNPDDLADYIMCFFGVPPCPEADFSADSVVNPDDLSDFITAFFAGCG